MSMFASSPPDPKTFESLSKLSLRDTKQAFRYLIQKIRRKNEERQQFQAVETTIEVLEKKEEKIKRTTKKIQTK